MGSSTRIYYDKPADNWNEALPIGNGRLGAMVFGRTAKEIIQMNEDSIWLGGYRDRNNPEAFKNLPVVRKLLLEGNISKAERLLKRAFSGVPYSMQPYQPLGKLTLSYMGDCNMESTTEYFRELDLESAVATTSFTMDGT
nr:glycoside hydrolase family 95 protein [Butyrivibrio sp.]